MAKVRRRTEPIGVRVERRTGTYLWRVVVDVLHRNVHPRESLAKGIIHLAGLNLQAQRRRGELLQIDLADEEQFACLSVHFEETVLVAQDDAVSEASVDASVLVEGHDGRLHAHLFSDSLALFFVLVVVSPS